ncbi:MAG TPA: hypothetical protein PKA00_23110 [Saprospiraceae bacterium]|nr:hypothetical protein [Saprospiraceae bacterium]HMQ85818.1 hypothetical protein [Saprospiraceae bacterium]
MVWDTWFTAKENLDFVHLDLKKHFVAALKSNQQVALSEQGKKQGQYQKVDELGLQKTSAVWFG